MNYKKWISFLTLLNVIFFSLFLASNVYAKNPVLNLKIEQFHYNNKINTELIYNLSLQYPGKYHNLTEVYQELDYFNNSAPDLVDYSSIGFSYFGNQIPLITLTNEQIPEELKGKTYIVAHHHAREMCTIENALRFIRDLVNSFNQDDEITALLNRVIIYIIVTLNPDSLDYTLYINQHFRKSMKPYDDDGDGLFDEDGPEDLDGNGVISQFWLYNQTTTDIIDYWWEGTDKDKDGKIGEDPPGGVDLNRNYPFHWNDSSADTGSTGDLTSFTYPGPYAFSENETRVLDNFVMQHHFTQAMSLHSGIESPLFGWSWTKQEKQAEEAIYNSLVSYAKANNLLPERFFPANKVTYTCAGEWGDYMYSKYNIIPVTLEIAGRATGYGPLILVEENETHKLYEKTFNDFKEFNPPKTDLEKMHGGLLPFEVFWVSLTPNITLSSLEAKKLTNGNHQLRLFLKSGSKYWNTTDKPSVSIESSAQELIQDYQEELPVLLPDIEIPLTILFSSEIPDKLYFNITINSDWAADLVLNLEIEANEFKQVYGFEWISILILLVVISIFRRN